MLLNTETRQLLEEELDRLAKKGAGTLTPVSVVDAARSPESPLHRYFEWNDSLAAIAHRLDQARVLIRSVRVSVTVEEKILVVPRYVHNPSVEEGESGYCALLTIDDNQQKRNVISSELATGMAHLRRAGNIALAIDNSQLHDQLLRDISRIEKYLKRMSGSEEE